MDFQITRIICLKGQIQLHAAIGLGIKQADPATSIVSDQNVSLRRHVADAVEGKSAVENRLACLGYIGKPDIMRVKFGCQHLAVAPKRVPTGKDGAGVNLPGLAGIAEIDAHEADPFVVIQVLAPELSPGYAAAAQCKSQSLGRRPGQQHRFLAQVIDADVIIAGGYQQISFRGQGREFPVILIGNVADVLQVARILCPHDPGIGPAADKEAVAADQFIRIVGFHRQRIQKPGLHRIRQGIGAYVAVANVGRVHS